MSQQSQQYQQSLDCFLVRGRTDHRILQRVQIRDTAHKKDAIHVPYPIAGTWNVSRAPLQSNEASSVLPFRSSLRFTQFVLENSLYPEVAYRIVVIKENELPMPARGGLEVPTEWFTCPGFQSFLRTGSTDWIVPMRQQPDLQQLPLLHNLGEELRSYSPIPETKPDPLKPYVARILAETARTKGDVCPITLESMILTNTFYVPTCGHVCSDSQVREMDHCPVCREPTSWTQTQITIQ